MRRRVLVELETDLPESLLLNELQRAVYQLQFSNSLELSLEGLSEFKPAEIGPCDE